MNPYFLLAFAWLLYYILHSVFASSQVKSVFQRWMGKSYKYYRLIYTVFNFLGLIVILLYQYSFRSAYLFMPGTLIYVAAAVLLLPGLILMGISLKKYFLLLSGVRSLYMPSDSPELKIEGVHRFVRHPLYLGTILAVWGLFLIWPTISNLIAVVLLTAYVIVGIGFEEKKLINEFGEDYVRYKRDVPMLVPFVKGRKGSL